VDEGALPEVVASVFDKLDEGDQESPRVWPVHDQPFQQYPGDLLHDDVTLSMEKEEEEDAGEVVGVVVGVAELIDDGVEHIVPALGVEVGDKRVKHIHARVRVEL